MIAMTRSRCLTLICLCAASAFVAAEPSIAGATPAYKDRVCGHSHDRFVFGPQMQYAVSGRIFVTMSTDEASALTRRIPESEFGHRLTAREVPCLLGQAVATSFATTWVHSKAHRRSVRVVLKGPARQTYIGHFTCVGTTTSSATVERCARARRRNGGAIKVRFSITPAPGTAH